jgi:hypothetical protein
MVEPIAMPSMCRHTAAQTRAARVRRADASGAGGSAIALIQEVRDDPGQAGDVEQEGAVAEAAVQHDMPGIAAAGQQGLVHAVGFGRRVAPVFPVAQEQHPGRYRRQRPLQAAVFGLQVKVLDRTGEVHEAVGVKPPGGRASAA